VIIEPEQLHSMAWGTYNFTRLVVARFSTFASGVVIPEARRLVPPACCSGFASCPAGHEGEPKGQLHVKTKTNKDNMAKLLIPGNGQRPPSVRSFDEVVVLNSAGNELHRRPFYGTMVLVHRDNKRQLVYYLGAFRQPPMRWELTALWVLAAFALAQLIEFFSF